LRRHKESLIEFQEAARLASKLGDEVTQGEVMVLCAWSLFELKRYDEAWLAAAGPHGFQKPVSTYAMFWGAQYAVKIAMHERHRDIVHVFKQWVDRWRSTTRREELPNPTTWLEELFISATRANQVNELDLFIKDEAKWLASESHGNLQFDHSHGQALSEIITQEGPDAAYDAIATILPRISGFIYAMPEETRIDSWLPNLISGFAANCRSPSLLRSLARLLAKSPYAEGQNTSKVLETLADVDESDNPEKVLSRTDPDTSTLVRRLRGLPDLEPIRPKRVSGRRRKRVG
jgi:hypothetical protein